MGDNYTGAYIVGTKLPGDPGYGENYNQEINTSAQTDITAQDYTREETFWENPKQIVNIKHAADIGRSTPGWEAPEWMDVDAVDAVYNYLQQINPDKSEADWTIPVDDTAREYLRNLPQPSLQDQMDYMDPASKYVTQAKIDAVNSTYQDTEQAQQEVEGWSKLDWDMQILLSFIAAGYDQALADRPVWTRLPATLVQGVMAGIAPAALASTVGLGIPAFVIFGGIGAYQAYTGQRIPVISDIYDKFQLPAEALESLWGQQALNMTPEERAKSFIETPANAVAQAFGAKPTAEYQAGAMKYETSAPVVMDTMLWALDNAYNLGSDVAGLFGGGWKKMQVKQAGEGYRWDPQKGINVAVKIEGKVQDAAIQDYYQRLVDASDEDFDKVVQEIEQDAYERFGYSGVINDLIGQAVLDPLFMAPFVEGIGTKKVAKLFGKEGLAEHAGRMAGNPLIDVLPIGAQQIAEAFLRGKGGMEDIKPLGLDIGVFGRRHASPGLVGTLESYKLELQKGITMGKVQPVDAIALGKFEKRLAGITDKGTLAFLEPVTHLDTTSGNFMQRGRNKLVNQWRDLTSLTPEAKAQFVLGSMADHIGIFSSDLNDPVKLADMYERLGNVDPNAVKIVNDTIDRTVFTEKEILSRKREAAVENSAFSASVAEGLKAAVNKVKDTGMMDQWNVTGTFRKLLLRLSESEGIEPGKFLEGISTDHASFYDGLKPETRQILTNASVPDANSLRKTFDIYIGSGKDKLAWHPDEMIARYNNAILDEVGKYLVAKYDIKPQGSTMRLIGAMKQVQSLLVLGINPGYAMNNLINNLVSRAVVGTFGFMTGTQIDTALDRMQMKHLARINQGVGAGGEGIEAGGYSVIHKAMIAKGALENFRKSVRNVSDKIGVFQKISSAVESSESRQAYTIGMLDMWSRVWKKDVGFQSFDPAFEKQLDSSHPGLKERIYAAARSSMNMDEIRATLNMEFISPQVADVMDRAIERMMPDGVYSDDERNAIRSAVTQINMEDDLVSQLKNAKTYGDVDNVINNLKDKIQKFIHEKLPDSLRLSSEESAAHIQTEGAQAALGKFTELNERMSQMYLEHFKELSMVYAAADDMEFGARKAMIGSVVERQAMAFKDAHALEVACLNGIIDGFKKMGLVSDATNTFVNTAAKLNALSDEFFRSRNEKQRAVLDAYSDWNEQFRSDWNAVQTEMDDAYTRYNDSRTVILREKDAAFAEMVREYSHGNEAIQKAVLDWREKVMGIEERRQKAMEDFRKSLKDPEPIGATVETRWVGFIDKEYTPIVNELMAAEAEGAANVAALWKQSDEFSSDSLHQFNWGQTPIGGPEGIWDDATIDLTARRYLSENPATAKNAIQIANEMRENPHEVNASLIAKMYDGNQTKAVEVIGTLLKKLDIDDRMILFYKIGEENGEITRSLYQGYTQSGIMPTYENYFKDTGKNWNSLKQTAPGVDINPYDIAPGEPAYNYVLGLAEKYFDEGQVKYDAITTPEGNVINVPTQAMEKHIVNTVNKYLELKGTPNAYTSILDIKPVDADLAFRLRANEKAKIAAAVNAEDNAASISAIHKANVDLADGVEATIGTVPDFEPKLVYNEDPGKIFREGDPRSYDGVFIYDGQPVKYVLGDDPFQVGITDNGRMYQVLGADNDLDNLVMVYYPENDEIGYIEMRQVPKRTVKNKREFVIGMKNAFGLTNEQARVLGTLGDARAKLYAKELGISIAEVYRRAISSIQQDGVFYADPLYQMEGGPIDKGSVERTPDGSWVIKGTSYSDISTALHEPTHAFFSIAPQRDKVTVTKWLRDTYKMDLPDDWMAQDYKTNPMYRAAHEKLTDAYERYMYDGVPPKGATKAIIAVFEKIKTWMHDIYKSIKNTDLDVDITDDMRRMFDEWSIGKRIDGETAPNKAPGFVDEMKVLTEFQLDKLVPALNEFGDIYKNQMRRQIKGVGSVDPEMSAAIDKWVDNLKPQMTSAKLTAQRYGEYMRDSALLNYTMRYGIDNYINGAFPYAFWYLRTMMNWGKRMIDRPAWYSLYSRLKSMQDKVAAKGLPQRFAGSIRSYAPWLPQWAGSNMFSDPLRQLFPLELYTDLGEGMQYAINSNDRNAQQYLQDMRDKGDITQEEYNAAIQDKANPMYVEAYNKAMSDSDMGNPVGLASMMMQPASWVTMPYQIGQGHPEKITILPVTKTSRAVGTALKGTSFEFLGNVIEKLGATPETYLREKAGVSPYGQWGDYYIDREIANAVADGQFNVTEGIIAMIDRKGAAYDEAVSRVRAEEMYKTPLMTALNKIALAISGKGGADAIFPSLVASTMPFGVLPIGEMKQRGLAEEYKKAWDMVEAGDSTAITEFFNKHPEYQARLAINKDPDERMKNLLISQIWDRLELIPSGTKSKVMDGLGEKFLTNFLDNETRDYDTIDIPTLAYWAQILGANVPEKTGVVLNMYQTPSIQVYSPEMSKMISDYKAEKNQKFPMVDILQSKYYAGDKSILTKFPAVKAYWTWKKEYEKSHPALKAYFAQIKEDIESEKAQVPMAEFNPKDYELLSEKEMKLFSPLLVKQIVANAKAGEDLGKGAVEGLRDIWEQLGEPEGNISDWYENVVKPAFSN